MSVRPRLSQQRAHRPTILGAEWDAVLSVMKPPQVQRTKAFVPVPHENPPDCRALQIGRCGIGMASLRGVEG